MRVTWYRRLPYDTRSTPPRPNRAYGGYARLQQRTRPLTHAHARTENNTKRHETGRVGEGLTAWYTRHIHTRFFIRARPIVSLPRHMRFNIIRIIFKSWFIDLIFSTLSVDTIFIGYPLTNGFLVDFQCVTCFPSLPSFPFPFLLPLIALVFNVLSVDWNFIG